MAAALRVDDRDVFMNYFPPFHVGNWDHMKPFLLVGGTVILLREFDPDVVLELLPRHRVSVVLGVPTMLHALITHERFPATDISSVRLLYYGAYDPSGIMDRTADAFGVREGRVQFAHTYGLTEAGPFVTWCPPHDVLERWGSIGRPMPGVDVALLDDDGREVAPGEPGEICVRGPADERLLAQRRGDRGGAGRRVAAHRRHRGRRRRRLPHDRRPQEGHDPHRRPERVVQGGRGLPEPRTPAWPTSAVIGLPTRCTRSRWSPSSCRSRRDPPALAEELAAFVRTRMAGYNTPRRVEFVAEFPRTAVGKVQKHVLRERFGS